MSVRCCQDADGETHRVRVELVFGKDLLVSEEGEHALEISR